MNKTFSYKKQKWIPFNININDFYLSVKQFFIVHHEEKVIIGFRMINSAQINMFLFSWKRREEAEKSIDIHNLISRIKTAYKYK